MAKAAQAIFGWQVLFDISAQRRLNATATDKRLHVGLCQVLASWHSFLRQFLVLETSVASGGGREGKGEGKEGKTLISVD